MTNYRNRIGEAIAFARNVAGRSQQELADMLGRDKRTIQKWERGEIRIALEDYLDVFDTLHLPVGPYEMWIRHPELFPRGMEDIKGFSTEKKRRVLADYYLHQAAPLEIEQEYYILFGDHGSNSCGIRQELLANLQTPLRDRKRIVNQIIDNYYEARAIGNSDTEKTQGLAELRAMRAYYYWQICDNFGDAPLVTTTAMDLPAKNTRREIFDFVENELIEVIPNLSEEVGGNYYGRMTKWAAKALLANLYLNAQVYINEARWNDCITQCDDIINSGKFTLAENYKDLFRALGVESCKEIIFTIPYDENFATGNSIFMFSWHGELKKKYNTIDTPWGCGSAMGVTQFIDTYNEKDSRLADTWLMGQQLAADGTPLYGTYDKMGEPLIYTKDIPSGNYTSELEGYRMNKFEVAENSYSSSNTDIPVFRYAEIMMMKAECLLRTGKSGAGTLVTQVRQRAFKDNPELATVTDSQLAGNTCYQYGYVEDYKIVDRGNTDPIQFGRMYDELGWEFAWEMHRRRDAIRFGIYTTKSWLSHKPEGDYRSVFPIPETVLTSNPNLEQNPNYL